MKLVFLGKLADLAGQDERDVAARGTLDWPALCEHLGIYDAALRAAIESDEIKVAVDGAVLPDKRAMQAGEGSEIAFLPPVSGG